MFRISENLDNIRYNFLNPMIVAGVDPDDIIEYLRMTSTAFAELEDDSIEIRMLKEFVIDPGGMHFTKMPYEIFEIDNTIFKIQLNKIGEALMLTGVAEQRFPNAVRFPVYLGFAIIENELFLKFQKKLSELEKSDRVMNALLDQYEIKADLESTGSFAFATPKGRDTNGRR